MPEITRTDSPAEVELTALLGLATRDTDGLIEAQEARGQRELVASEQLPTEAPIADLEALGFTFGPVADADPLFRPCTLPEGWRREASDHPMWSYIVDEKGRHRVAVFYKAAFYDRSARASLVPPTERLFELIWQDDEPTEVVLDELLTADVARDYLAQELATYQKRVDTYAADDEHCKARKARIEALLRVLPATPTEA